jgi:Tfp pilus assembly protein PilP
VIWGTANPRAILTDPTGKGYIIAEGTPIGKNQGRVIQIANSGVTVKETYVDFLGNATTKDIELRLQGRKKGG